MISMLSIFTVIVFLVTVGFIIWRPFGMNEAVPASIGATLLLLFGVVPIRDLFQIVGIVTGPSITILSTIVMSIVLESTGFFKWAAYNLVKLANGSGIRLFWYVNLLCFLMTMFFNNDGSILITTPIIIRMLSMVNLRLKQQIPYLLSGALIATASSAPIGISNLANLIALKIVGLDLNTYAMMMFVPSMLGIAVIFYLLLTYFRKQLPKRIQRLDTASIQDVPLLNNRTFTLYLTLVILIRASYFVIPAYGIDMEWIGIAGAILLISIRWFREKVGPLDLIKKTPWHIFLFALSVYVLVFGLRNIGLTSLFTELLHGPVSSSLFHASMGMGIFTSVMSNLVNNLPSVMMSTVILVDMQLPALNLQTAYLASIIGSDVGSLIFPMGTLASLIWMFILRSNGIAITWKQYLKVTYWVIPLGFLTSLISLYLWVILIT